MKNEGHTYITNDGRKFLVLEGSFTKWNEYLAKNPNLKDGSFQCSITKKNSSQKLIELEKGIFQIVE